MRQQIDDATHAQVETAAVICRPPFAGVWPQLSRGLPVCDAAGEDVIDSGTRLLRPGCVREAGRLAAAAFTRPRHLRGADAGMYKIGQAN
jgi:hypothetical protein